MSDGVCRGVSQAGSLARAGCAASNTVGPQTTGSVPTSASEDTRMLGSTGKGASLPLRLGSDSGSLEQVSSSPVRSHLSNCGRHRLLSHGLML